MHKSLLEITDTVQLAQEGLLKEYSADQLYDFRVATRRIRSILKRIGSHRARGYRKTWGGFAAVTNEARDWDVFLLTAEKLLSTEELGDFRQTNSQQVTSAHEAVTDMLASHLWQNHLAGWRQLIERVEERPAETTLEPSVLEHALAKARRALSRALETDKDRRWHKFRIAVKEVRYLADALAHGSSDNPELADVAASCRKLQTVLGNWHDTVVQLGLLRELPLHPVHAKLRGLVEKRKEQFLSQTRDMLVEHPLFAP